MFRMLSISQRSMLVATIATLPLILSFLTCVAVSTPASAQYGTLYNFRGYPLDGSRPVGALVQDPATAGVYGTTVTGGPWGDGTVYAFSPTSSVGEKLLHTFKGTDGSEVTSTLVVGPNGSALNAALYGTTSSGGKYNKGTVFEVNTDGSGFHVLHNFSGKPDGANPVAGLVMGSDLRLYGTTQKGGAYDQGAVFSLEAYPVTTKLSVLYSFRGATSAAVGDGAHPAARLLNVGTGAFVGTTYDGGKYNLGTVFQLLLTYSSASAKPKVKELILWSFAGGAADGANPAAEVIDLNPEFRHHSLRRHHGAWRHGRLGNCFRCRDRSGRIQRRAVQLPGRTIRWRQSDRRGDTSLRWRYLRRHAARRHRQRRHGIHVVTLAGRTLGGIDRSLVPWGLGDTD